MCARSSQKMRKCMQYNSHHPEKMILPFFFFNSILSFWRHCKDTFCEHLRLRLLAKKLRSFWKRKQVANSNRKWKEDKNRIFYDIYDRSHSFFFRDGRSLTLSSRLTPSRGNADIKKQRRRRGARAGPQPPQDGMPSRERERTSAAGHSQHLILPVVPASPAPPRLLVARLDAEAAGQPGSAVERQVHRVEHRRRGAPLARREQKPRGRADGRRRALRPRRHPVVEHQRARSSPALLDLLLLLQGWCRYRGVDVHREGALAWSALVAAAGPVRQRGDGGEEDDGEDGGGDDHAEDDPGEHRRIISYLWRPNAGLGSPVSISGIVVRRCGDRSWFLGFSDDGSEKDV